MELATSGGPLQVTPKRRKIPSWLPQALGYTISIACLVWVLHGYDLRQVTDAIRSLEWKWVTLAVIADLAVYVIHGWRWNILLSPVKRLGLWRSVQAVYIGLFANEVLPLRTGELIRCYLLAHWNNMHLSVAIASAALERLLDGIWMVAAFIVTASLIELPSYLVDIVQITAALLLLGVVLLLWVVFHKHHAHAVVKESRWATTLRHVIEGVHLMGNWRTLGRSGLASLVYLVLQMITVWGLMQAYEMDLSFWAAAAVLVIVRFATVIPNAPGNLGLFQASCVLALSLFGVQRNEAKTFSFVMFFALTLPLLLGGAVAVALTGLNISEIRHRARRGLHATHQAPAPE